MFCYRLAFIPSDIQINHKYILGKVYQRVLCFRLGELVFAIYNSDYTYIYTHIYITYVHAIPISFFLPSFCIIHFNLHTYI